MQRKFIYGNYIDEVLRMIADGNDYYYAHDHLYSPAALIDSSGTVLERYEYDAYGNCSILEPNFASDPDGKSDYGNNYLFTGRRLDILDSGSLKIQYNRNRYYDYYTGRWLTHDPMGIDPSGGMENPFLIIGQYKDGLSLYEYSKSNPADYTDPMGLKCCPLNTCDCWLFTLYKVYGGAYYFGFVKVSATLKPFTVGATKCCFTKRSDYRKRLYDYFGIAAGLGIKFSFTASQDSKFLETKECVKWGDWTGAGSVFTGGLGMIGGFTGASFERAGVKNWQMGGVVVPPEAMIDAGILLSYGTWWLREIPWLKDLQ